MTREKLGGTSLITGAVALLLLSFSGPMGFHLSLDDSGRRLLAVVTNLLSGPFLLVLLFGLYAFARQIARISASAELALVLQGGATLLALIAACGTSVAEASLATQLAQAQGTEREALDAVLLATEQLTDALRLAFVALSAVAALIWSVTLLRADGGARNLGVVGLLAGSVILAVLFVGHVGVHVHVEDLAPLVHGIWYVLAGRYVLRT